MQTRQYTIDIHAPRATVWRTMLDDATYRAWTQAFCGTGSWFEGTWAQDTEMRFVGPDPDHPGTLAGMYALVRRHDPHAALHLEHQGILVAGQPDATSDAARVWAGTREHYTFADHAGGTRLVVEQDLPDDQVAFFDTAWPAALQAVKGLAEG